MANHQSTNHTSSEHPCDDPALQNLLTRLGPNVANSFSTEQLFALRRVVSLRGNRLHLVDVRATMKLPFVPWSFYVVLLGGKNRRSLSEHEKTIAFVMLLTFITCFLMLCLGIALAFMYVIKSWFGIDLFEHHSLGLWDWLQASLHLLFYAVSTGCA